ncbi:hypothetical protein ACFYNN_30560 [Streptomyces sp. NPDC006978]|uniref:hypothetical protein n=1 Tax=unclassified Streptomyces TaxID=2593676 RepID=UPI002AFFDAD7|nr:hypothetical protein [Streptomyces sp. S584]
MPPTTGIAQLYTDQNYAGMTAVLDEGTYNIERLSESDSVGNDTVSSLRVADGYKITVYTEAEFSGASKEFTADAPYVGDDFNDQISSVIVTKVDQQPTIRTRATSIFFEPISIINDLN